MNNIAEYVIEICGIQLRCRGEEATGYVEFDPGFPVPICSKCAVLTGQVEDDTLDESHGDVA